MIAYHIDRSNSLIPGQTIDLEKYPQLDDSFSFMASTLFGSRISRHGRTYLADASKTSKPNTFSSAIEFFLELVRLSLFKEKPSRFRSVFCCQTMDDVSKWLTVLPLESLYRVFEVEVQEDSCFLFDASMMPPLFYDLDDLIFSPSLIFESCYNYWSGHIGENPCMELLTDSSVRVLREIPLPIYLTSAPPDL